MPIPIWIKKSDFLSAHLNYVKQTESPILFHIWSAIGAAGAAMGRHTYLETGIGNLYPNIYCLVVGPPATRKNAAINFAVNMMKEVTNVKFAPDDTGGQRQGLIVAIQDSDSDNISAQMQTSDLTELDIFNNAELDQIANCSITIKKNNPDKNTLFICATEFGSFLGQGSLEMTRFLNKMWDGEDYRYKIRKDHHTLREASLSLLGGTTPSDLASLLPAEAIGQGFMSRIVLVFASQREKSVSPENAILDLKYKPQLEEIYKYLFADHIGPMKKTKAAAKIETELYEQDIQIPDSRFIHYGARRHAHLAKLAMVLAATNMRKDLIPDDYLLANEILKDAEKTMSDALGEYGLSPLAASRQKMIEFIQHANGPVRDDILWAMLRKDMRLLDFKNCLSDLINAHKILKVDTDHGPAFIYNEDMSEIFEQLAN